MELVKTNEDTGHRAVIQRLNDYHAGKWVGIHTLYDAVPEPQYVHRIVDELVADGIVERKTIGSFPMFRYVPPLPILE